MLVTSAAPLQRLLATAILSASALFLEIVLTRLFSVIYYPPYVFFIISFAIFGIGIGAALPALRPSLANERRLALYAIGATLTTMLLILVTVLGAALDLQILLFILVILPYTFFGTAISSLFTLHPSSSRTLYMSDLVGAGIGAVAAIPLLNIFGAVDAVFVAAIGFALAGVYLCSKRHRLIAYVSSIAAVLALATNAAGDFLEIDMASLATDKPIVQALSTGGSILQSRWDAFARTDLVDPAGGRPLRIYVDGAAASIMPSQDAAGELIRDIGFFPFATEQPLSVFVIGPGAGLDIWFALQSGAQDITAVEVNAASVELVDDWRGYNGNLYGQPAVTVQVDDGRSALRRSSESYDLIYLSQVVTLAAELGGYALSENTIYTVDAFSDYLHHLNDDGHVALKLYDEITLTRALSTAISALRNLGVSDQEAMKHLMVFVDEKSDPPIPLLLIGKRAFVEDDSLVLAAIARDVGFAPLLLPHVLVQPPLDVVASGAMSFDGIVADSASDISAPTDNRPYFFQFERGVPSNLIPLAVLVACAILVLLAAYIRRWLSTGSASLRFMPAFFVMLGIGFIAVEIYAIQRTRLFLGHPTLAITVVLTTFLIGGGLGSGFSQRFLPSRIERHPQLFTAIVVALLIVWSMLWTTISQQLSSAEVVIRCVLVAVSLLPLALCMGIPFPQALAAVGQLNKREVALAWSVNGAMTVGGSVFAVVLSITLGFSAVAWLGAGAYLLATLILIVTQRLETE